MNDEEKYKFAKIVKATVIMDCLKADLNELRGLELELYNPHSGAIIDSFVHAADCTMDYIYDQLKKDSESF